MGEKKTNYDKTREDAEQRFLAYDQEKMIRKFQLEADEAFLYLRFVGRDYRINRKNGKIEWNRNRSEKIRDHETVPDTDGLYGQKSQIKTRQKKTF